jgi:Secretion system C-terminal sorting domain
MKNLLLLFIFSFSISIFAQPVWDFETTAQDTGWTVFTPATDTFSVVPNPDMSGLNTTANVAKFTVDQAGAPWEGVFRSNITTPFVVTAQNAHPTLLVYKDVTSRVDFKYEGTGWSTGDTFDSNTVVNQWQKVSYDFSAHIGDTVKTITVIPDFATANPRTYSSVNYFDLITFATTVVPVELTSFTGNYVGNTVQLKWSTATELNNKGFEVQRSIAGNDFITLGFVHGKGTTTESNSYSFIDKAISANTIYSYRLKQMDLDGSFHYSGVANLGRSLPVNFELSQNYPNPFNPSTKINVSLPINSNVSLDVYNLVGEKVMTVVNGNLEAGNYDYTIDGSKLSSGVYVYRLVVAGENGANFTSAKKMTLLK